MSWGSRLWNLPRICAQSRYCNESGLRKSVDTNPLVFLCPSMLLGLQGREPVPWALVRFVEIYSFLVQISPGWELSKMACDRNERI